MMQCPQQFIQLERCINCLADTIKGRQLADTSLALLEQPGILERDRRLIGHASQQRYLVGAKLAPLLGHRSQHTYRMLTVDHRHAHKRDELVLLVEGWV